jgi:hypothetical protein
MTVYPKAAKRKLNGMGLACEYRMLPAKSFNQIALCLPGRRHGCGRAGKGLGAFKTVEIFDRDRYTLKRAQVMSLRQCRICFFGLTAGQVWRPVAISVEFGSMIGEAILRKGNGG